MKSKYLATNLLVLFASAGLTGQTTPVSPAAIQPALKTPSTHAAFYLASLPLRLDLILPPAASPDSAVTAAELGELHRIEQSRTPAQIAQAQADDREQDIFLFANVLGPAFTASAFPATAALSSHVHEDEAAVSVSLKSAFSRPRPYQVDATLHPVCKMVPGPTSYPSGHALSGYLLALTLVQLVPEKREQIFARADAYAHNRLVCGVHYASDTEASRELAYAVFASLSASPRFQQDLAAAREETRRKLGLPLNPTL